MFNKDVKVPLHEAELVGTSSSNTNWLLQVKDVICLDVDTSIYIFCLKKSYDSISRITAKIAYYLIVDQIVRFL